MKPRLQSHLSEHHNHLDPWSVLVAKDVVHEGGTWISTPRGATKKDFQPSS